MPQTLLSFARPFALAFVMAGAAYAQAPEPVAPAEAPAEAPADGPLDMTPPTDGWAAFESNADPLDEPEDMPLDAAGAPIAAAAGEAAPAEAAPPPPPLSAEEPASLPTGPTWWQLALAFVGVLGASLVFFLRRKPKAAPAAD